MPAAYGRLSIRKRLPAAGSAGKVKRNLIEQLYFFVYNQYH